MPNLHLQTIHCCPPLGIWNAILSIVMVFTLIWEGLVLLMEHFAPSQLKSVIEKVVMEPRAGLRDHLTFFFYFRSNFLKFLWLVVVMSQDRTRLECISPKVSLRYSLILANLSVYFGTFNWHEIEKNNHPYRLRVVQSLIISVKEWLELWEKILNRFWLWIESGFSYICLSY